MLSIFLEDKSNLDSHKPKTSLDTIDGKGLDETSTYCTLPRGKRRPSKQLEHLFEKTNLRDDNVLLEEKRLEEEQKLKEYKEASKEVGNFALLLYKLFFSNLG